MSTVPSVDAIIRFGSCELDSAIMEVRCEGIPQKIEPKAFAVLSYLIEHRAHVVSKDELLDQIWRTPHVSESVVPRAITKLRRAIGDQEVAPQFIKTIHRVGYRFIGDVQIEARGVPKAAMQTIVPGVTQGMRVAVLPIRNLTGDAELDWVEFGMMTLAERALEKQSGLSVMSTTEVIGLLAGDAGDGDDAAAQARTLRVALGVDCSIVAELHRESSGYALSWREAGGGEQPPPGVVYGADLPSLGVHMSQRIATALTRREASAPPIDLGDTFLNEAYVRALQAFQKEQYSEARSLMAVCMSVEPRPLVIDVDHFMMMSDELHAEAIEAGKRVLERAVAAGDGHAQARILYHLSTLYYHMASDLDAAEDAVLRCAQLIDAVDAPRLRAAVPFRRAEIALRRRNFAACRNFCAEVMEQCERSGDARQRAYAINMLGINAQSEGHPDKALPFFEKACAVMRDLQLMDTYYRWLCNLALTLGCIGQPQRAIALFREFESDPRSARSVASRSVPLILCFQYLRVGRLDDALAMLDRLREFAQGGTPTQQRLYGAEGHVYLYCSDVARAAVALSALRDQKYGELALELMPLYIAPNLHAGHLERVEAELAEYETMLAVQDDSVLRSVAHGCRAQLAQARGDFAAARRHNDDALRGLSYIGAGASPDLSPFALDTLWLAAEDGEPDRAAWLIDELGPWLVETCIGVATLARFRYAQGRFDEALALQRQYLDMAKSQPQPRYPWLAQYEEAAQRGIAVALPRAAFLPSIP